MTIKVTCNLNDKVTVELTDAGLAWLDKVESGMNLPERYRRHRLRDGNVWSDTLWQLMQIWGERLTNGGENMFVGNTLTIEGYR
jgi:hypothetical protein